jgi:O-antigen/teichoic acid export membrane protein
MSQSASSPTDHQSAFAPKSGQPHVARKILMNTVSQVVAKVIIGLFSVFILKMLTTYLGKEGYGIYKSIYEYLALFAIVADMGLYTIGVREMSKDPEREEMVLGNMMMARTVVIVLISIVAFSVAFLIDEYRGSIAPYAVALAAVGSVFAILTGTVSTALQVHLQMEKNSLGSVAGKLVSLAYMAGVIYFFFPHDCAPQAVKFLVNDGSACSVSDGAFIQLVLAGLVGNIVMYLVTAYYARKLVKMRYRIDWWFWKEVLWKALPYGVALILNQIYFRIGSVMLLNMPGFGATYVATYSAPSTMLEAAGIVPLYFMNAILPFLTRALHAKDGSHKPIIQTCFDFLMMSALPIVTGTVILAYQFIYLIATPEFLTNWATGYVGSDIVLQILIIALLFSFLNGLFGYVLVASEHQDKLLVRNLIGAAMTVVLTWWWIPLWGVRGAAFANIITEFYIFVASYILARRYVEFQIKLGRFFKILLATVVMGAVVYYAKEPTYYLWHLQNKNFILLIPLGGIVYFAVLILTGALTKEMIMLVMRKKMPVTGDGAKANLDSAAKAGAENEVVSEATGSEMKDSENQ